MPDLKDPLDRAKSGDSTNSSKLEASLAHTEIEKRPNSNAQNDVNRHAEIAELFVNELDFDFDLDTGHYPLDNLRSLQQVFDAVQCHRHVEKKENFSLGARLECLKIDSQGGGKLAERLQSCGLFDLQLILSRLVNTQ